MAHAIWPATKHWPGLARRRRYDCTPGSRHACRLGAFSAAVRSTAPRASRPAWQLFGVLRAGAAYTGIAMTTTANGTVLLVSNFAQGSVDVYDTNLALVTHLTDSTLPEGFAPFNVRVINDQIFEHLITGFTDASPVLRELTVKAVLFKSLLRRNVTRPFSKLSTANDLPMVCSGLYVMFSVTFNLAPLTYRSTHRSKPTVPPAVAPKKSKNVLVTYLL